MVSRITKVLALFLIWTSMGLYLEIAGPTMIDIKLVFNATYNEVSRSVSGRGAGGLTGALIGGILIDKFDSQLDLFVGVSESLAGLAVMSIPYSPSVSTLWFHYFFLGTLASIMSIEGFEKNYIRMETGDRKMFHSFLLVLFYLAMGLFSEISGPTLTDLKLLFKTDYESLTRAMAGRGIGGILGTLLGGALVEKYESQSDIFLGVFTMVTGLALAYIPFAPYVEATWYAYFMLGMTACVMNILGTRLVLRLWEEKSSTVLQLMLMFYGIGALTMPLLCSPFLATIGNQYTTRPTSDTVQDETRIHVPYLIVSVYLFLLSKLFCLSYLGQMTNKTAHTDNENETQKLRDRYKTSANTNEKINRTILLVLFFIYFFNCAGCEKMFGNFIHTISIDIHKLAKNEASYMNTVFWCSYTFGRLIISILTRYVTTRALLVMNVVLHFGSIYLMNYYSEYSLELFWALTVIEGLLIGPLFGLVITYGNTLFEIKGKSLAVIAIAANTGQFVYVSLAGTIYDEYGPKSLLSFMCLPALFLIIPSILMILIRPKYIAYK